MLEDSAYGGDTLFMSATQPMIDKAVRTALEKPALSPLAPLFSSLVHHVDAQLSLLFASQHNSNMAICSDGKQAMESCLYNLLEPHESILVLMNGIHGQRICDLAGRLGYHVDTVSMPWGQPILPENIKPLLKRKKYALVAVTHAESSTGVASPMVGLGHLVHEAGALFMVDCMASLGGMPVLLDDWCVDVGLGAAHYCLACPSGLSLLSFSQAAVERLKKRSPHLLRCQQNLYALLACWKNPKTTPLATSLSSPFSSPLNASSRLQTANFAMPQSTGHINSNTAVALLYALHETLNQLLNEELHNVFLRHRSVQKQLVDSMRNLDFRCYVGSAWRLPMVSVFHVPEHLSAKAVRHTLLHEYGIDTHDSLGYMEQYIRIGHMGHTARSSNVARLVEAMESIVKSSLKV